jgi:hypothetical protein
MGWRSMAVICWILLHFRVCGEEEVEERRTRPLHLLPSFVSPLDTVPIWEEWPPTTQEQSLAPCSRLPQEPTRNVSRRLTLAPPLRDTDFAMLHSDRDLHHLCANLRGSPRLTSTQSSFPDHLRRVPSRVVPSVALIRLVPTQLRETDD